MSRLALEPWLGASLPGRLMVATLVLYGINTLLVAAVLCLAESKPMGQVWQRCYFWSFPYYLVGAAAAGLMLGVCRTAGWPPSLLVLPLMVLVYVSYRVHVQQAAGPAACRTTLAVATSRTSR